MSSCALSMFLAPPCVLDTPLSLQVNIWKSCFHFSCCPKGSSTLFHSKNQYDSSHNDSYIVCADSAAHRLHADKSRYCTSGDWKTEVLEGESSGMSMRNVDGKAVIQYWGNNTNLKSVYRTKKQEFDIESKHYCVRSFRLIF